MTIERAREGARRLREWMNDGAWNNPPYDGFWADLEALVAWALDAELKDDVFDRLFDIFWASYPRKVGKENARKALKAVFRERKPAIFDKIMEALSWQVREWDKKEKMFIPYPASWLRGGRFEDERDEAAGNAPTRPEDEL